jgi:NitT/TauT family transport system substrate-binding protein
MLRFISCLAALMLAGSHIAQAEAPTVVKIGWGSFFDVPQLTQAVDKNLWKDQNLAPEIISFATGRESFEALIGGQLDFAILTEFPAVTGAMRGLKFAIPAALSRIKTMKVIAKSTTPVTSMKQLAGKKIAAILGTNLHFLVLEGLKMDGVTASLVNVGPADMIPALVRGDVDAAATFPSAYQAAKRTLGDQYQEIPIPGISQNFVLVASNTMATEKPEVVKRLLAVLLAGEKLVDADPKETQEASVRYGKNAVPLAIIQASWSSYSFRVQLDKATVDLMAREATWLRDQGLVKNADPAKLDSYFMTGPLKELAPDRVEIK